MWFSSNNHFLLDKIFMNEINHQISTNPNYTTANYTIFKTLAILDPLIGSKFHNYPTQKKNQLSPIPKTKTPTMKYLFITYAEVKTWPSNEARIMSHYKILRGKIQKSENHRSCHFPAISIFTRKKLNQFNSN